MGDDLVAALRRLDEPSREDLYVLLVTWLRANATAVATEARQRGEHLALVEPLPAMTPAALRGRLREAASFERTGLVVTVVAAARALDDELGNVSPMLLGGEHAGIDGDRFRVRRRIEPGGIDDLYGVAKDDPTFGVARRMACVPVGRIGDANGVALVDGPPLPAAIEARLDLRRRGGTIRVVVDGLAPDDAQWTRHGGWTQVHRAHDAAVAAALDRAVRLTAREPTDVLLLPELALDPASLHHLSAVLRRTPGRSPCLTVAGLCHAASPTAPLVVNEAVVLDATGRELVRHRKLAAFAAGEGARLDGERLDPGHTVTVLATPIGNLSVLICKDLFADRPEAALQVGYVTWLFVPSLSPKTGPHADRARQLKARRITTVVCNTWPDDEARRASAPHLATGPTLAFTTRRRLRASFEVPV